MKKLFTITCGLLTCLFLFAFALQTEKHLKEVTIKGKVTDTTGEPLIGANVLVEGSTCSTITDMDGNYQLTCPHRSKLVINCSYTGFFPMQKSIRPKGETELLLNFKLEERVHLEEVVVSGYSTTKKKGRKSKKRSKAAFDSKRISPTSTPEPPPAKTEADSYFSTMPLKSADDKDAPADFDYKEISSSKAKERIEADKPEKRVETEISNSIHKAGTLTAGEIHDFSKWELWQDIAVEDLNEWAKSWNYNLTQRYVVQVLTENGFPIVDATVELMNNKKKLWTARTDNTGKAELWANVFSKDNKKLEQLSAQISYNGQSHQLEKLSPFQKGINFLRLDESCKMPKTIDVLFVVDATSSMADELSYIQTELYDVIQRVQQLRKDNSIRLGSVFYRDIGDVYITRKSDLSADINKTIDFIKQQSALGGGDYPEAVDKALTVAVEEIKWSDNSIGKFLFLILDAPPHHSPSILTQLENTTKKAAKKGIRIIPIASSGINKSTEYLLRSFALSTNGTYTFLTDHSGIGNPHIEPSTDEYQVEKLNDLLVRLMKQFTEVVDCNTTIDPNILANNPNQQQQIPTASAPSFKCFPNPTTGIFTIDLSQAIKEVFITDSSGKNLIKLEKLQEGTTSVDLSAFPSGTYYARAWVDKKMLTEKLVLIRDGLLGKR